MSECLSADLELELKKKKKKKSLHLVLGRVWRKGNPPTLLVGMHVGVVTVENRMELPEKTKTGVTI